MRIAVNIEFSDTVLPADYSRSIISFIKFALSNAGLYEKYYDNVKSKPFCWALKLDKPTFDKGLINLRSTNAVLIISTLKHEVGIDFYNAFKSITDYELPYKNKVLITDISAINQGYIRKDDIYIKMISPIVVREHTNKDKYFCFNDNDFEKILNGNIEAMLKGNKIDCTSKLKIIPVQPKKTVTRIFGSLVNANIGIYRIKGEVKLLNAVYTLGLGSRRGAGCGMFEVIA